MFAILFEALLIEIQEEIHHFAGWEGGGLRGAKIVNKHFVNKLASPSIFGTRYEQFCLPDKVLSQTRLSEGIADETCANLQACGQNIN